MKDLIAIISDSSLILRNRIQIIIKEFIHHDDRSICDLCWPVIYMDQKRFDDVLCSNDPFQVIVGFGKKTAKPFFASNCFGKVKPVKYGEFLFLMKDGDIVEGDLVYLHT